MARQRLPLTPGSSSDIKGKDGAEQLSSLQLSFELPPPAMYEPGSSPITFAHHTTASPQSPFPLQPAEAVKSRRRSSTVRESKDGSFALPPPPTRSRKIIQMKPRTKREDAEEEPQPTKNTGKPGKASSSSKVTDSAAASGGAQGKKKQPSATSAAGRKIARKTAHSLIERRRRSKMNEEFAVLKDMIPACSGDMHKLAILQASIDYIRYLEDCVDKLKAQHEEDNTRSDAASKTLPSIREFHPTFREDPALDVEMSDSEEMSPRSAAYPERHYQPSVSPAILPEESRNRQQSYSSVSTDHRHQSYCHSAGASPAFGPQTHGSTPASCSTLTSPALQPQTDPDHEATAALLMLNNDRRGLTGSGRGLSVRDLLSS